jgi:hypothetical protein
MVRTDETWHRLLGWTQGQAPSERLAAQILAEEGFAAIDPSHPLGGKDGGKDAVVMRNGERWVMAAYFPRERQTFNDIKKKFLADSDGVSANDARGLAFVSNQELRLGEREDLDKLVDFPVEIYHLERIATILDRPGMAGVRKQFLDIGDDVADLAETIAKHHERLEALQTGGDTFCYVMLYHFDSAAALAQHFVIIRKGDFPLYDLHLRIRDLDAGQDVLVQNLGEVNGPAKSVVTRWPLRQSVYYRIFLAARNGQWTQDLQLHRSEKAECWLAATRVRARNGDVRFVHVDSPQFEEEFGDPQWRP